ncbi:MAG TPA: DUF4214 domain-containing protein [Pyrinomonadaceae bacterium]|jgi:hypothetical protein
MKKLLCILTLAFFGFLLTPQQAQAQYYCSYGIAYGTSYTWQSGSSVYFYSSTELDYCAGLYYDPATWGRYSEGLWASENVRLLGEGYTEGYADWVPAEIAFNYGYPSHNQYYNTDTRHYVLEYYQQYYCFYSCGYYWYDPWGWGFAEGSYGGPSYFGYGGAGYWQVRRRRLGDTTHTIRYQAPNTCEPGQSFTANGEACSDPTPTPTPAPHVQWTTETTNNGIPLANGAAVGSLPNRNSTQITATGTPSGGTFSWSTSSDKVTLSSTSGSAITVTSVKKSDAIGDVVINITYTYIDGRSSSASIPMTVQQPTEFQYVETTVNQALPAQRPTRRGSLMSGWRKDINFQLIDQLGQPMYFRVPVADTMNFDIPNDCFLPRKGHGTTLSEGKGTSGSGIWTHVYTLRSTSCINNGTCTGTGYQRYTVNGFELSNDDKTFRFQCNGIQVEGDGSTLPPSTPPARRKTAMLVNQFYSTAFEDWPSDDELLNWTNRLNTAAAQGQEQLLAEARALARAVFQSAEYINLGRSDEDFVTDLYNAYLWRAPDADGYNFWLNTLRNDNAQGINGREHLLQAFEYSTDFANLIYSLEAAPPSNVCDVTEEQNCYSYGGSWNSSTCACTYYEPPDPCYGGGTGYYAYRCY